MSTQSKHKSISAKGGFFLLTLVSVFVFVTTTVFAQPAPTPSASCNVHMIGSFKDLVMNVAIGCIILPSFRILVGIAIVVFLWGVFKFIRAEGDDKQQGREFILYGIIGLFVMVSVAGLVNILKSTFNTNNSYDITPRQVTIPGLGGN